MRGVGSIAAGEGSALATAGAAELNGVIGSATNRPGAKLMELEFASANATSTLAAAFVEEAPVSAFGTGASATLETVAGSLGLAETERFDADKTGNWKNSTAAASNIKTPSTQERSGKSRHAPREKENSGRVR